MIKEIKSFVYHLYTPRVRDVLKKLINENQCEVFAEIGVWKGDTSGYILDNCKSIRKVICVDPYNDTSDYGNLRLRKETPKETFRKVKEEAIKRLDNPKVTFHFLPSNKAYKLVKDNSLDFVFIDANHKYEFVKEDITLWLPKVKVGGIIAGDDFKLQRLGVVQAALELLEPVHVEHAGVWWKRVT